MRIHILVILICVVLVIPAHAAYQNPTIIANNRTEDGTVKLTFRFTGNAGEPDVQRVFSVGPATTLTILRNWVDATINELDLMRTASTAPQVQVGQTITRLAPVAPTPSAKDVWQQNVANYRQFCTNSFTGGIVSDCDAIKTNIQNTYQAGFLDAN